MTVAKFQLMKGNARGNVVVGPAGYMQLVQVQMLVYRVQGDRENHQQGRKMPVRVVPFPLPCNWEKSKGG